MAGTKRNTSFRLDPDLEARIEAIRDAAQAQASGPFAARPERSTVLRALLEAGARVYEEQLGLASLASSADPAPAPVRRAGRPKK